MIEKGETTDCIAREKGGEVACASFYISGKIFGYLSRYNSQICAVKTPGPS